MPLRLICFALILLCPPLAAQVPTDGLQLWLCADEQVDTRGSEVLAWKDKRGNGISAEVATPKSPLLVKDALNGHAVIRFNGINTGLTTNNPIATFPRLRGSIIIVSKVHGRSRNSSVGMGTSISTYHGNGLAWQVGANPLQYFLYDGIGSMGLEVSDLPPNRWGILSLVRRGDTTLDVYRSGRYQTSLIISGEQPDTNTIKIGHNGMRITSREDIVEVMDGDIAEILIYDHALPEDVLEALHESLSIKYGFELLPPPVWQRWWFYVALLVTTTLAVMLMGKLATERKLKRQIRELEQQREIDKERLRISREMHDDIGAGLTRIALMTEIAKHHFQHAPELSQIADTSRQLVNNISEIIWSLNPGHRSVSQLLAYLREELGKLLEVSGSKYTIDFPNEDVPGQLGNEQNRNVLLIAKEIVHNAVKHSGATEIRVSARVINGMLELEVADNGKGYDPERVSNGNGLRNIQHRLKEAGATWSVVTAPGNGVIAKFSLPLKSH